MLVIVMTIMSIRQYGNMAIDRFRYFVLPVAYTINSLFVQHEHFKSLNYHTSQIIHKT